MYFLSAVCVLTVYRLDVWNLIPGEGSAEIVKAMVKEKIQVRFHLLNFLAVFVRRTRSDGKTLR